MSNDIGHDAWILICKKIVHSYLVTGSPSSLTAPQSLHGHLSMTKFLVKRNVETSGEIGNDDRIFICKKTVHTYLVTGGLAASQSLKIHLFYVRIWLFGGFSHLMASSDAIPTVEQAPWGV